MKKIEVVIDGASVLRVEAEAMSPEEPPEVITLRVLAVRNPVWLATVISTFCRGQPPGGDSRALVRGVVGGQVGTEFADKLWNALREQLASRAEDAVAATLREELARREFLKINGESKSEAPVGVS